jgi:hypothetical protein
MGLRWEQALIYSGSEMIMKIKTFKKKRRETEMVLMIIMMLQKQI